jgi:osmotically-inducible protein OsmY
VLLLATRADERRSQAPPVTTPGPGTTPGTPSPSTPGTTSSPSADTKMSNSDLENAVKAKLSADEQLKAAKLDVDANASKNEVTISGTVQSQDHRNKAVELAKSAHSGVTVNDKIDVKPAS